MAVPQRRILVTGANGFIGQNLAVRLREMDGVEVLPFVRGDSLAHLATLAGQADAVFHLAGENRPEDPADFVRINTGLTEALCRILADGKTKVPVIFTSSTQAAGDSPYGRSKLAAETALRRLSAEAGNPIGLYRLPGVFGKWSRPHYNSVVATFCHQIARDLPIRIDDPEKVVQLAYIDDVVGHFLDTLDNPEEGVTEHVVAPLHRVTLQALADRLRAFRSSRETLLTERVGEGFARALYATYLSHMPPDEFSYPIPEYRDERGTFVEMLKTADSGQFSFLTARPGITRGGHYHHTKAEKFLVLKGRARFRFRHLLTDERVEIETTDDRPEIVETIPGWAHDITNIGDEEMIVMLWASEIFDRARPDTVQSGL